MSNRSVFQPRSVLLVSVVLALLLVGCGSGEVADDSVTTTESTVTSTTLVTTTTTVPTTTSAAAPTTTTTLDADGVLHTFIGYMTDPTLTARAEVSIDLTLNDVEVSGEGEMKLSGEASHLVLEFPGLPVREVISINDIQYERSGGGPWTVDREAEDPFAESGEPAATPLENLELVAMLQTLGELESQGTMLEGDEVLHLIGLPEGVEPDPVAFGLVPEETAALRVSFLATTTGLPRELWLQFEDLSSPEGPIGITFSLRFVEFGIPVQIDRPQGIWLTYVSDAGYSISHPTHWDVDTYTRTDEYSEDRLYGLQREELAIYVNHIDPPGRIPLNAWLEGFRSSVEEELGATMGTAEEFELDALPARRVTYVYEEAFGTIFVVYVVVQTDPETVFEFIMFGDETRRAETETLLDDFLSTFTTS